MEKGARMPEDSSERKWIFNWILRDSKKKKRKKEVISGEEMENTPDFEAQRKRLFPLPFLAFSIDVKTHTHTTQQNKTKHQSLQAKLFLFLEDVTFP